jgi:2-polyprenyl-6-methoxyphenol hydroxylase-like FAD-dependent oxidoreductase
MTVLIAGSGIAGLTMGLTLHQMGIPFRIFEAVPKIKPLGVGINLQPNAVRELFDLGLEKALDRCGVRTKEYGFFTKTGNLDRKTGHRCRLQLAAIFVTPREIAGGALQRVD